MRIFEVAENGRVLKLETKNFTKNLLFFDVANFVNMLNFMEIVAFDICLLQVFLGV
jgi:hypothetical protein